MLKWKVIVGLPVMSLLTASFLVACTSEKGDDSASAPALSTSESTLAASKDLAKKQTALEREKELLEKEKVANEKLFAEQKATIQKQKTILAYQQYQNSRVSQDQAETLIKDARNRVSEIHKSLDNEHASLLNDLQVSDIDLNSYLYIVDTDARGPISKQRLEEVQSLFEKTNTEVIESSEPNLGQKFIIRGSVSHAMELKKNLSEAGFVFVLRPVRRINIVPSIEVTNIFNEVTQFTGATQTLNFDSVESLEQLDLKNFNSSVLKRISKNAGCKKINQKCFADLNELGMLSQTIDEQSLFKVLTYPSIEDPSKRSQDQEDSFPVTRAEKQRYQKYTELMASGMSEQQALRTLYGDDGLRKPVKSGTITISEYLINRLELTAESGEFLLQQIQKVATTPATTSLWGWKTNTPEIKRHPHENYGLVSIAVKFHYSIVEDLPKTGTLGEVLLMVQRNNSDLKSLKFAKIHNRELVFFGDIEGQVSEEFNLAADVRQRIKMAQSFILDLNELVVK